MGLLKFSDELATIFTDYGSPAFFLPVTDTFVEAPGLQFVTCFNRCSGFRVRCARRDFDLHFDRFVKLLDFSFCAVHINGVDRNRGKVKLA